MDAVAYHKELKKLDHILPSQAVYLAWKEILSSKEREKLEKDFPLLARCLDRL